MAGQHNLRVDRVRLHHLSACAGNFIGDTRAQAARTFCRHVPECGPGSPGSEQRGSLLFLAFGPRPWSGTRTRTDTAADMSAEEPLYSVATRTRMRLDGASKRPCVAKRCRIAGVACARFLRAWLALGGAGGVISVVCQYRRWGLHNAGYATAGRFGPAVWSHDGETDA